jgi:uncharacterized membrane protein
MRKWLPFFFIAFTLLVTVAVYDRLPERMPTHWNMRGEVDGWSSRPFGAFGIPVLTIALWGFLRILPKIDPRRANYDKFRSTYDILIASVIGFMSVLHLGALAFALGLPIAFDRVVFVSIALLHLLLGNFLPRARPNWFVGIRTPWTLSNDRVWERTHRVGGYAFTLGGAVMLVTAVFAKQYSLWILLAVAMAVTTFVLVYSYVVWRQEGGGT